MLCNQNLWLSSLIFGWRRGPVRGFGDSTSISSGGTCPCRAATWCSSDIYSARFFPSTLVPEGCGLDGSLATTPRPLFAFQTFRNACRLRKLPNRSHLLFSCYVVSDFLQLHQLQHPRLPCPSLSPGVCSTSCPLSHDAIQPSHLLSPLSPHALNLSQHQGLFQWVSSLHKVPKYWSISFSISPSNEYSGLIFFRIDWFDPLAVQGTLKNLLQHHISKVSILIWLVAKILDLPSI